LNDGLREENDTFQIIDGVETMTGVCGATSDTDSAKLAKGLMDLHQLKHTSQ